jgi:hypothetical protein
MFFLKTLAGFEPGYAECEAAAMSTAPHRQGTTITYELKIQDTYLSHLKKNYHHMYNSAGFDLTTHS